MNIALFRHGQVDGPPALYGRTDVGLSEAGLAALQRATAWRAAPALVVSSPLRRCRAFATETAARAGVELRLEPALREMDFGDWDGRPYREDDPHWPAMCDFWRDPVAHPPPGGESLAAMRARVQTAWQALLDLSEERVWVFAHGGVIRLLLAELLQLDWRNPALYSRLHIGYASRTDITVQRHGDETTAQVRAIGVPPYGE